MANTSRLGRNKVERPATMAATSVGEKAAHTVVSFRILTPALAADWSSTAPSRNWRSRSDISAACEGASGLKYWPPGCSRSSATITSAPASARLRAAVKPAGPAPTTRTSQAISSAGAAGSAGREAATGAEWTSRPGSTLVRQARWLGRPFTVTRQSKQTPMPQKGPRGAPERVRRTATMSAAASAAAMVSPVSASISAPSNRMRTGAPAGRVLGCFRRMAKGLQWLQGVRHEEVSRHLYRADHAFHRRRQEGRRGGAAAPGRLPDHRRHPRPDPARQHRRVLERDARRTPPDRRDRDQAGGRPRAGADRHRRGMDRRGGAHQPRGRIDGRRRRDDHPALLQRADRRRALCALQEGIRRDRHPDHGLQQPGDGQCRHAAGTDRAAGADSQLPVRQGIRRSIRRACATSFASPARR